MSPKYGNSNDIKRKPIPATRIRKKYISRLYIAIIAIFVCAFAGLGENISANAGQPDSFTGSASIVITNRGAASAGGQTAQCRATITLPNGSQVVGYGHCISGIAYAVPYDGTYSYTAVHQGNGRYKVTVHSNTSAPSNAGAFKPGAMKGTQQMGDIYITYIVNGSLDLQKASDNTAVTNGNGNYSLAGAQYGIWNNDLSGTNRSFVTDGNGYAKLDNLTPGWYWVHEIKAPKGYQLDTTHGQAGSGVGYTDSGWYHVEVVAGENRRIHTNNVYDTPRIGKITVQKKDAVTDSAVTKAGFKFRLLASDKTTVVRAEQTSDDNGQVTFENLGFGTYYVQETAAVSPFALNSEPVAVSVSDDGSTGVKTFVAPVADKICYGNAEIKKIDNVKSSLVPGVGYDVVAQEDIDHPDGTVMYHKGDVVQHLVTGNDGTATTKDGESDNRLYIGADGDGRYAFVETSVPAPLTIDRTPIPFTITYAGDHAEKIETVHAAQVNNVAYGAATINKTDNVLGAAIPNTTYDVKATEDITLWNGTIIYHKGEKVDSLITDENGNATTTTRLYVGTDGTGEYALTETSVPTGATIKTDPIPFTITYQNETVEVLATAELRQINNIAYGSAKITKTDSVINSNVPYAEFDVIATEDITLWNGHKIYENGQIIEHLITDENGTATTKANYYVGSDGDGQYEFVETAVRAPLLLDTTPIPFTITYKDANTENVGCVAKGQKNSIPYAPASLTKTDNVLNSGVPGVEYDVRAAEDINLWNGTIYRKGQVIDHVVTGSDGKVTSTAKYYPATSCVGRYEFVETKVPTGLTLNSKPIPFTVNYKNQTEPKLDEPHVTQRNNVVYGSAKITKTDSVINSNVPYAEFDVIAAEDITLWNGHKIYKKNQTIEHVITGQDGVAKTHARYYVGSDGDGQYKFVETKVRTPLLLDTTPIPFTITYKDAQTENVGRVATGKKNDIPYAPASLAKTDNVLNSGVPGVEYDVRAAEDINLWNGTIYRKGQVIDHVMTGSNGKVTSTAKYYPATSGVGRYEFVETKVPTGLTLNSKPIPFTVNYKSQTEPKLDEPHVTQTNNVVYGSAKITKTDSVINSNVPYAEFDVIAAEDITLWNGHRIYKKNQIIEHVITGQDGVARTHARYYVGSDGDGQYKFVETEVRAPLLLDTTPIPFTITYKDAKTENVGCVAKGQKNDIPYAPASLTKTDNVLNSGVPGVEYDVRAAEDINLWNGTIYRKGQVLDHVITDSNGEANSTAKYYPGITGIGRYEFVETKVPTGLTIDTTSIPFTVKYKNQTDRGLAKPHVKQTNNVVYGAASIKKTETTNGTNISGAEFDVVAVKNVVLWNNNVIYRKGDVIEHVKTNSDGIAKTTKPLYVGSNGKGEYKFVETFTPCPYYNNRIDVPFTINYLDDKTENVKIEESAQKQKGNEVQIRQISFKKTDFSNDAPIEGAVFELSPNSDIRTQSGSVIYKKNQVIGTYTTDKNGSFKVHNKTVKIDASGSCSYKFVEIKAPKGYVIDSTPANFTIKYAGQNVEVQSDMSVSIKNRPNTFKLSKSVLPKAGAGVTDTTVQNATFRLWNKSDELPVPLTDGTDSYALRIDNGSTSHDVTVAIPSDETKAALDEDSEDGYSIVLTDEKGNLNTLKDSEGIDLPASRYTISLVDKDGVAVASFDGDKHIDLRGGKKAVCTVSINKKDGEATVTAKVSNIDGVAATVEKKSGAYIASGLKSDTKYQVEVDGKIVYTFETSKNGGKTYYGRYDTTAKAYAYKRQPMLLTSDSKFIDKFTINGKDYPVQMKIDTNGEINFTHVVPGSYGIGETDVPVLGDKLPESTQSYLISTDICYFDVDETTGKIDGVSDFETSATDDYTVVTLSKVEVTGGDEIPGAKLEVQDSDGGIVDSWTSTDTPHVIERLVPGKYSFVERMTPNRYDQATRVEFEVKDTGEVQHVEMIDAPIEINAQIDKCQEIATPVIEETSPNGDGKNKANAQDNSDGSFEYSLDYRSTSSTWTDEFTVYDPLDGVNAGYARLDSIMTAQGFEDYDGKMNVWYRTNKTPSDYTGDIDKANATVDDGHVNPWIAGDTRGEDSLKNDPDGDGRVIDYTGWRLWEKDVPTTAASKLNVADLKLDSDEYVTAFRFEYGRVEKGFTTRTSAWDRDELKDEHDDLDNIDYLHDEAFKMTSFGMKKSIANALLLSVEKPSADTDADDDSDDVDTADGSDTDSTDTEDSAADSDHELSMLKDKLIEIANSDDEDAINGIIPSVKAAVTDRLSSLIDAISAADTDDDATAALDAVKSAYGKFSSLVGKSDGKKVDAAFEKVSGDLLADGASDTLDDDIAALKSAIGASIEALDVSDSDAAVKYAPAVIGMHVTDGYIPEKALDNSAYVDAYRNGGGEHLEGHDSDKVTQQTKQEYSDVAADIINLVQTGIDGTPYIVTAILAATACVVIVRRKRN